jgi:excisionase family DNA binding protein
MSTQGEGGARKATEKPGAVAPEFLTLTQAAQVLQVSTATLPRAYQRGELRAFLIGNSLRIRRADLNAFIERNTWTPALCAERTARPLAGRRKRPHPSS